MLDEMCCLFRVLDVVLCYDFRSFMLKFAYTMVVNNYERIASLGSTEDILEFLNYYLPSKIDVL